jgi:hypothetical protein
MAKASVVALALTVLAGCAAIQAPPATAPAPAAQCNCTSVAEWVAFVDHVDGLDETGLVEEYATTLARYQQAPDDAERMRLSYLLSRPQLPMRDIGASQVLLTQISADSPYAPLRDLLAQETALQIDLQAAREQAHQLRTQLEALKGIDTDLTRGQEEIEELSP